MPDSLRFAISFTSNGVKEECVHSGHGNTEKDGAKCRRDALGHGPGEKGREREGVRGWDCQSDLHAAWDPLNVREAHASLPEGRGNTMSQPLYTAWICALGDSGRSKFGESEGSSRKWERGRTISTGCPFCQCLRFGEHVVRQS